MKKKDYKFASWAIFVTSLFLLCSAIADWEERPSMPIEEDYTGEKMWALESFDREVQAVYDAVKRSEKLSGQKTADAGVFEASSEEPFDGNAPHEKR